MNWVNLTSFEDEIFVSLCGVVQVNAPGQNYYLGFAQFESYEDWNSALLIKSSDVLVEKIESFPMR